MFGSYICLTLTILTFRDIIGRMETNVNSIEYQVPSFGKHKMYDFAEKQENNDIYNELSQIAEEIERCRLRNC